MKYNKYFKKFIRFFSTSIFIYSFWGTIILFILVAYFIDFYDEYTNLIEVYNQALLNKEYFYRFFSLNSLEFFLAVFPALYYLLFTLLVLIFRILLRRKVQKSKIDYEVFNNRLVLKFNKLKKKNSIWNLFGFQVLGKLKIKNLSLGDVKVTDNDIEQVFYKDSKFSYNLEHLDTGVYEIQDVKLSLIDIFRIFKCSFYLNLDQKKTFTHLNQTKNKSRTKQALLTLDKISEKTVMNQSPEEGYYGNREYQWGDEVKKVHWKNTAKVGKLMVRVPEEIAVNRKDLVIVLNLYTPFLKKLNQSILIDRFLSRSINFIKTLLKDNEIDITLYINGKSTVRLSELKEIDSSKIDSYILRDCVFQSDQTFENFYFENMNEFLDKELLIFSMSTDKVLSDQYQNSITPVIFKCSEFYPKSIKQQIIESLFRKAEYSYVNIQQLLGITSFRGYLLSPFLRRGFKRLIIKNEKLLINYEKTIVLQ